MNRFPRGLLRHRHGCDDVPTTGTLEHVPDARFVPRPRATPQAALPAQVGGYLFFDAPTGAAGDMIVASLMDIGVPDAVFSEALAALGLTGVHYRTVSGLAGAIGATQFSVHFHPQPQRVYADIRRLLEAAPLPATVRDLSQRIFLRLAEAEAEVHRVAIDSVHFHEVGAVDSIVDIVLAAAGLCHLGAAVVVSPLPLGRGFTTCQHGVMPLPAPATLLALRGAPTYDGGIEGELVTPTGAAILATVADEWSAWPRMTIRHVGWGAGTRTLKDRPNALRAVLGEGMASAEVDGSHAVVECNVDDMTGEALAHVIERLIAVGALDAWASPITTKKGRPAWTLAALGTREQRGDLETIMLYESTTIGLRSSLVTRRHLPRRRIEVQTPYGLVSAKVSGTPGARDYHAKPEFESCRALAAELGLTLREVTRAAEAALASTEM